MLVATCHCKAVGIEVSSKPESLTQCTCSICNRYGSLWAYYNVATAAIKHKPEATTIYRWNDKVIEFHHCNTCGCLTHYEDSEKTGDYRIAVNARMMSPIDIEDINIKIFDGADTWKYLDL